MQQLRDYFNASFRNKLVIVIPTITCAFWFIPSLLYFAFLGRETFDFLAQFGVTHDVVDEFMFKQIFGFAIVGGGAMLGLVALLIIMTRHISNPLYELTLHIDQMNPRTGCLPDMLEEERCHNDETARLKRSINRFIRTAHAYEEELQKQAHFAAVGQTAAMIAHDVRKPLAIVKGLMQSLPLHMGDPGFIRSVSGRVDAAFLQTESLLKDVLEFSSQTELSCTLEDPQSLVMAALGDVFQANPNADIAVRSDLYHGHMIRGDRGRLLRVISNIVQNAIEAMKFSGSIWLETRERDCFCEIAIGNDGPPIPAEVIPKLFDAFFTMGKKGGTGLGLAICQRIIQLHGGDIRVDSADSGTEFVMTLPLSDEPCELRPSEWITHSREVSQSVTTQPCDTACDFAEDLEKYLELHKARNGMSRLLVVDDESLFRDSLRDLARNIPGVREHLTIVEAVSPTEAQRLMAKDDYHYVISDIDFGPDEMNGYDFVNQVAAQLPMALFLMHSNKRVAGREGILTKHLNFVGYNAKPMKVPDLLRFLATPPRLPGTVVEKPRRCLIVNDDEMVLMALRLTLRRLQPHLEVRESTSVTDAKLFLDREPVDIVLCDINFGSDQPGGFELLRHARQRVPQLPFYLVSGYSRSDVASKLAADGASGYLQHPIKDEELLATLR